MGQQVDGQTNRQMNWVQHLIWLIVIEFVYRHMAETSEALRLRVAIQLSLVFNI